MSSFILHLIFRGHRTHRKIRIRKRKNVPILLLKDNPYEVIRTINLLKCGKLLLFFIKMFVSLHSEEQTRSLKSF